MRGQVVMNQLCRGFVALLVIAALSRPAQAAQPNWSGLWEGVGLQPAASGGFATPVPDIIRDFGSPPPYTPAEELKFRARLKAFDAEFYSDRNPLKPLCIFGFPTNMLFPTQYFEILVTARETAIIHSGIEIRHIYTDGRAQPPRDELWPTHWGSSVGHWEGNTLIVATVGAGGNFAANVLKPGENLVWILAPGPQILAILDDEAHYVERIRMAEPGVLEDQMTIYDSTQFMKPWKLTRRYQHVKGVSRMVHEDCEGNDRNPIVNGRFTLK
jgi:hypothetical protein